MISDNIWGNAVEDAIRLKSSILFMLPYVLESTVNIIVTILKWRGAYFIFPILTNPLNIPNFNNIN